MGEEVELELLPNTVDTLSHSSGHPVSSLPFPPRTATVNGDSRLRKNITLVDTALVAARSSMSRRRPPLGRGGGGGGGGRHGGSGQGSSKSFTALGRRLAGSRTGEDDGTQPAVDKTLVYETLRPLFRCLTAVGACFVRRPKPPLLVRRDLMTVKSGLCGRRLTFNWALILAVIVSVVLTANWARSLTFLQDIRGFSYVTTFKLLWIAYYYEGMSRALMALVLWYRRRPGLQSLFVDALMALVLWYRRRPGLQSLFVEFDARFYTDDIVPYEHSARKLMRGLLVGSAVTLTVVTGLVCYGLFTTDPRMTDVYHSVMLPYSEPPHAGAWPGVVVKVTAIALMTWNGAVMILFLDLFVLLCYILYKEFEYLGRTFEMKIAPNEPGRSQPTLTAENNRNSSWKPLL